MVRTILNIKDFISSILSTEDVGSDNIEPLEAPELSEVIKLCLATSVSSSDLEGTTVEDLLDYLDLFNDWFKESSGNYCFLLELKSKFDAAQTVVRRRLL